MLKKGTGGQGAGPRHSAPQHGGGAGTGITLRCSSGKSGAGPPLQPQRAKLKPQGGIWNHRMVWVGKDLKDHLVPTPLP